MRIKEIVLVLAALSLFVFLGVGFLNTVTDRRAAPHETLPFLIVIAVLLGFMWVGIRKGFLYSGLRHGLSALRTGVGNYKIPQRNEDIPPSTDAFMIQRKTLIEEGSIVLSIEEVPLDNRHGSSTLISEHEFSHTATSSLKFDRLQEIDGHFKAGLWSSLEAGVRAELSRTLGIEVGQQITRRVLLRFEATPGKLSHYRVIWKQNIRRELVQIDVNNETLQLPYTVTHGLYHAVESVSASTA